MPSGSVAIATSAAARVQQEHRAHERDDDRLLEQRAPQGLDGPMDQVRAVVRGHDRTPAGSAGAISAIRCFTPSITRNAFSP